MEDPERKIMKARVKLMFDFPFFGHLALNLELVKAEFLNPPTMATDGIYLYWHPEFVKEVKLPELVGVVCHECGHVLLLHPIRRQGREPRKWNVACDYVVNDLVLNEKDNRGYPLVLPKGALYEPEYANKTAEWVYNKLPDQPPEGGGEGGPGGGGGTLDSHEPWKNWEKGEVKDSEGNTISTAELEQKVRENVAAAVTAARMAGKLSGNIAEKVNGLLEPRLDWKSILRDMVVSCAHNDFRLIPPSKKHLWRNIYLPATTGEEIVIAAVIDSSGSISSEEAEDFIAEIHGICRAFENFTIYLFMCDSKIQQRWELHPYDEIPNVILGRGGTSFRPPLEVIEKEALPISSIIYLTDLYPNDGYPNAPSFPVIWVSVSGPEVKPPWGEVIHLPRERRR